MTKAWVVYLWFGLMASLASWFQWFQRCKMPNDKKRQYENNKYHLSKMFKSSVAEKSFKNFFGSFLSPGSLIFLNFAICIKVWKSYRRRSIKSFSFNEERIVVTRSAFFSPNSDRIPWFSLRWNIIFIFVLWKLKRFDKWVVLMTRVHVSCSI